MAKKSSAAPASSTELAEQPTVTTAAPRDLKDLREFWHTNSPFDPVRALDSWETRFEQGKALRERTPRESHGNWQPDANRTDPVTTVLASNAGREESLIPLRMWRMPPVTFRINHEGRRVVLVQRCLQSLGDPLPGYTTIDGRHHFVRQMKNLKASMPIEFLTGEPFEFWGFFCGALLARAHARSGDIAKIAG